MGNPLTDCQKELKKLKAQMERRDDAKTIAFLQLEQENELLRRVVAGIDTRLDMQLDFFHSAINNAGTLSELKSWWENFLKDAATVDHEADDGEEQCKAIREKHNIHWKEEEQRALRVEKNIKWLGGK